VAEGKIEEQKKGKRNREGMRPGQYYWEESLYLEAQKDVNHVPPRKKK